VSAVQLGGDTDTVAGRSAWARTRPHGPAVPGVTGGDPLERSSRTLCSVSRNWASNPRRCGCAGHGLRRGRLEWVETSMTSA
jgi:hypothetical protein